MPHAINQRASWIYLIIHMAVLYDTTTYSHSKITSPRITYIEYFFFLIFLWAFCSSVKLLLSERRISQCLGVMVSPMKVLYTYIHLEEGKKCR